MSIYSFKLAAAVDKEQITSFIDTHWGSEHPLIHDEKLFEFYYKAENNLQFALCYKNNILCALCGYILANASTSPDIWVSIWVANKEENGAGLELMAALPALCGARVVACNNIRKRTMPFYTFLGYTAARLEHFYRLSNKISYSICKISTRIILPISNGDSLVRIENQAMLENSFLPNKNRIPYKDNWYITKRYFNYPYQKYNIWRLSSESKTDALIITRTVEVNGTFVLRIVDYTGAPQHFSKFGYGINELMSKLNVEYADIYCYGITPATMANAGFCERLEGSENIIPNYLSPPLYENTEYYFFTSCPEGFTMFKADGDQDRPNILM